VDQRGDSFIVCTALGDMRDFVLQGGVLVVRSVSKAPTVVSLAQPMCKLTCTGIILTEHKCYTPTANPSSTVVTLAFLQLAE
jgi:hypothetical protein